MVVCYVFSRACFVSFDGDKEVIVFMRCDGKHFSKCTVMVITYSSSLCPFFWSKKFVPFASRMGVLVF